MGFSRQEHWSGLPCPPPGNLPDPEIEPVSLRLLHCRQLFTTESPGKTRRFSKGLGYTLRKYGGVRGTLSIQQVGGQYLSENRKQVVKTWALSLAFTTNGANWWDSALWGPLAKKQPDYQHSLGFSIILWKGDADTGNYYRTRWGVFITWIPSCLKAVSSHFKATQK